MVEPTHLKKYESKWESSPNRTENKTYLSCHHLGNYSGSKGLPLIPQVVFFQAEISEPLDLSFPFWLTQGCRFWPNWPNHYGGFLKWWVSPTTMGFSLLKIDHFGVFWGATILGNTHIIYCRLSGLYQMLETAFTNI